ncbi:YifB family Mg chelatase-like AAA ATPase [Algicola sagamiensis]|uniref:YifB family Mg chelatase-like AAA ATPase n=1 Tax=Algicola sagamiensis TaxID=163869 RepID=UPI00036757CC|nr:YifB family Mg chelatase-like AAA ATPase [Algicola sagamiensis]
MTLSIVHTRASNGIEAPQVTVEVHIANGLPGFSIVGLPETSVKEARDRVKSALQNSGFEFPAKRITVNLAPADLPKEGGRFDLPIAIGILSACDMLPGIDLSKYEFYGELALSGKVRNIHGEIPLALAAKQLDRYCILPEGNMKMASLVREAKCIAAPSLKELYHHLLGQDLLELGKSAPMPNEMQFHYDLRDVIGQQVAKRALEIAAAGQHNLLFLGPPGTGKSMLAQRLLSILPPMTEEEAVETAAIHSICGKRLSYRSWCQRPFRAPHHTSSAVALVGGGSQPKPGEISLAHNGVLFLDELPEFDRKVLDVLREPMETGEITISRAARQADFPSRFQLVAAMNPSPTGHHEDGRATADQVMRYLNRLSGPLLDRIDIQLEVPRLPKGILSRRLPDFETSADVRARVIQAREKQLNRSGCPNALLSGDPLKQATQLIQQDAEFLENVLERLKLSTRAYHKILKVARTIADLQGEENIQRPHLAEALGFRAMDRLLKNMQQ